MNDNPTPEPVPAEPTPQPEVVVPLDSEGHFTEAFRNALPDELGNHSMFDKYGNLNDLVVGFANTQKLVGKKAEDFWTSTDPQDIERRKEIMGVPNDPSAYKYEIPEALPEQLKTEAITSRIEAAKEKFQELGINAEQAQALLDWDLQTAAEELNSFEAQSLQARTQAEEELKKEWKGNTYEYNVSKARDALEHLGLGAWVEDPALGDNPAFIKDVFEKLVPLTSDDAIIEAKQASSYATVSDQLSTLEGEMRNYAGHTSDAAYQKMVSERAVLLQKLPQRA